MIRPQLFLAVVGTWGASVLAAPASFEADCRALTQGSHRLCGTPESAAAAKHVEQRLRDIGVDEVVVQEFPTTQTVVKRCDLQLGDSPERLPLLPLRPNGIIPPVSPPDGLTGRLLQAGRGELEDYGDRDPHGAIVVLDYNSDRAWLRAFQLGAKAVILLGNGRALAAHTHFTEANVNLPRYYYAGPATDLPDDSVATIHSEVIWAPATGRNVFGFLRGTQPVFGLEKEEVLVLAAPLDSFGEVPTLAPAARSAANCAALLEAASYLQEHRPRRHVLVAFFDNDARAHEGSTVFYRAIEDDVKDMRVENRRKSVDNEQRFLGRLHQALGQPEPLQAEAAVRRALVQRLKLKAEQHANEVTVQLFKLRRNVAALDRQSAAFDAHRARVAECQREKSGWNDLRRALARDELSEAIRANLQRVIEEVRQDVTLRTTELELQQRCLAADQKLRDLVGKGWFSLHASLLLGDATDQWGLAIDGDSDVHSFADKPGLYAKVQGCFAATAQKLGAASPPHFVMASADGTLQPPRMLWAAPFLVHSGEVAGHCGIYNLALVTAQERLPREGTPADTLDNLRLDRLERQAGEIATLVAAVASEEGLSLRRAIEVDKDYISSEFGTDNRLQGPLAVGRNAASSVAGQPLPGVTIKLMFRPQQGFGYRPIKFSAFDNFRVLRSDQNGGYTFGPQQRDPDHNWLNAFAATFDERGVLQFASAQASAKNVYTRLNLFEARGGAAVLTPQLQCEETAVLDGTANGLLDPSRAFSETRDGVTYWYTGEAVDSVKLFGLNSVVCLVNGPELLPDRDTGRQVASDGRGFDMTKPQSVPDSAPRAGADLWRLDEERLEILRAHSIMNKSIEELHGRAQDWLLEAAQTNAAAPRDALSTSAFFAERQVYADTRGTLDDLVHAVLVLLALTVPFAFALERLLIGSTNVYRQIGWFAALFTATFLVLFLSHPAFAISKTPLVIFLGFAVVVLSSLVIFIIMRKFEVELKVLQGMTSTVHAADVSRLSTIIAAMNMGISTMRRRPLRTALTAVTIILLTFTILCFASFGTQIGVIKLFTVPPPPYTGALLRQVNWTALDASVLDVIRGRWADKATICPRFWLAPEREPARGVLLSHADGSSSMALKGLLGVSLRELPQRPDLAELLGGTPPADAALVWITESVAQRLQVREGDTILLGGRSLRVGKLLDPAQLGAVKDMDGSSIVPVDFVAMQAGQQGQAQARRTATLTGDSGQSWTYLPADGVAVVSAETAEAMGGTLRAVGIYTPDVGSATAIAEDLAQMLPLPISGTRQDGVYRHVLGETIQASGAKDLLFPILLGGLVIFGTMLGSVADREREIYTFSALGLAPAHVASLFFAEALVYSVIGGLSGYLLAQGSQKVLGVLAGYGLLRVPEMNYSSTNAIVTILIVMATVLVSAIYPAIKASRSANPGVLRAWRVPPATGDRLTLVFPFTVSDYDITGVVSFLKEHFDNFTDTGLGLFMSRDAQLVRGEQRGVGLTANLALAPFDLGVTQSFHLRSAASEIAGIDEVQITIVRQSGQPKDWQRLNKVLLDDLRRQFLIWRALPSATMEVYRQRTLTAMGSEKMQRL